MRKKLNSGQLPICVVIPAFKVKAQLSALITPIGPEVGRIIVIDDACPEKSGKDIMETLNDPRLEVLFHEKNLRVGGAVKTGYLRAIELNENVIVKIDGDGQMDTSKIIELINPIVNGKVDYAKGGRFHDLETVRKMPKLRVIGNLGLSFLAKLSSGNWRVFDPNNGFTAISRKNYL
jgi:dolichol-phosphate mannosyltransferase